MELVRFSIKITGIVQGVGFRPTVYRYAADYRLTGTIINNSQGVFIEVQGALSDVDKFKAKLRNEPPKLARIDQWSESSIEPLYNETEFKIEMSKSAGSKDVLISPDIATCPDCISDIKANDDRRFGYAFTNCTNCGPRFSIIKDRPYDRELTSMSSFPMCKDCDGEYKDPLDRRFHAQPNACAVCGPELHLLGRESNDPFQEAIDSLKRGEIVAIKGLGGFNIACDASNLSAVKKLRAVKNRPSKAFAVMMSDVSTVSQSCYLSQAEQQVLEGTMAPIVLLRRKTEQFEYLSPDNNYLGVMLPYTPLHHLLMNEITCLVMTSANKASEPIAITDAEVEKLINEGICDIALSNNRPIVHRCDDSIVQFVGDRMQFVRRSRGAVPEVISVENVCNTDRLSLGGNMKNTFALKKGKEIYMSQHIGELIDVRNYDYQKEQIADFRSLLEIDYKEVCSDAHPGYENFSEEYTKVYHHHAHMLSAMGEHGLLGEEVVGVICDGTGFGTDGNIWGFEFLKVGSDHSRFERLGHLSYFPLPGGERAIFEIDRIAVSLGSGFNTDLSDRQAAIEGLIKSNMNCPLTSSLGRLFDGVAAILGIASSVSYESQAAMLLQKMAESFDGQISSNYQLKIDNNVIDHQFLIKQIIDDINKNISKSEIAYKFHLWLVNSITEMLKKVQAKKIVLSGGCFQNVLLSYLLEQRLSEENFQYYFNQRVPVNDAGISFGQALI